MGRRAERWVFVSRVELTSDGLRPRDRLELGSNRGCSSVMVPLRVAVPEGGGGGWSEVIRAVVSLGLTCRDGSWEATGPRTLLPLLRTRSQAAVGSRQAGHVWGSC